MTSATIVLPVLNGAATIADALRALLGQTGPEHDVIVVDNGSTDGTQDIVAGFGVTLLHCATPGVSACRNLGLAQARGEFYLNLDCDTVPTRNWLREMIRPFADPAVTLVGGRTLSFRPETGPERYIDRAGLFSPANSIANPVFPFVIGCNLAVRSAAARSIGGWDEALLRGDDIDFATRLLDAFPQPLHYAAAATLFHRNRRTDAALAEQAEGYGKGIALIYRRYPERVHWGTRSRLALFARLVARTSRAEWLRAGHALNRVRDEELEFARYDRLWARAFWRGFRAAWRVA